MAQRPMAKPFSAHRPDLRIVAYHRDLGVIQAAQNGTPRHSPTSATLHGSNTGGRS
jgi:hypothetical protein